VVGLGVWRQLGASVPQESPRAEVPVAVVRGWQVHDLTQPAPVAVDCAAEVKDCPARHRSAVGQLA
jgi:hypothetical protein